MLNTITVYLGSSGHAKPVFKNSAIQLGTLIGKADKHLIYGGMDAGLMGLLAASALKNGGAVTGIVPRKIQDSERMLAGLTKTLIVEELCDRKRLMFEEADAVITLAGGFGTADEALEVLYWASLKLHSKPILFVNTEGYWDDFLTYAKALPDLDPAYIIEVSTVEEAMPALENWETLQRIETPAHMPHFEDEITRGTDQPIIIDKATLENTYFAICALGLKQLGKHSRPIGFLNTDGQFDNLLTWISSAAEESFITQSCLTLFDSAPDMDTLLAKLANQTPPDIDLHEQKWGKSEV